MAKPRRTPIQVVRDQQVVAEMYLKGSTMAVIADKLGHSLNMVSYDLREVRKRWRASAVRDFDAHREEQLARLDLLEAAAWREWERSCEDYWKKTVGKTSQDDIDKEETGAQTGDPRYINAILSIVERRCRLLGLDAPTKVAPTTPEGDKPYQSMTETEIDSRIAELLQKLDK